MSASSFGGRPTDYLRAAAIALAALFIERAIWLYIQLTPFVLLTLAVLLAAWRTGWGPALVAIAIASLGGYVLFLPPTGVPSLAARDLVTIALFIPLCPLTPLLPASSPTPLRPTDHPHH